jgi:hypothetical protein
MQNKLSQNSFVFFNFNFWKTQSFICKTSYPKTPLFSSISIFAKPKVSYVKKLSQNSFVFFNFNFWKPKISYVKKLSQTPLFFSNLNLKKTPKFPYM